MTFIYCTEVEIQNKMRLCKAKGFFLPNGLASRLQKIIYNLLNFTELSGIHEAGIA